MPCVNIVYTCVGPKMFFVSLVKFINENIYLHGSVKISSLINRSQQELLDSAPISSIPTLAFVSINLEGGRDPRNVFLGSETPLDLK